MGNDIIQGPYGVDECARLAQDSNEAKGFITNREGTYCWIKNKLENYIPNNSQRNSYVKKSQMPLNVYKKYNNQDCAIGKNLMFRSNISLNDCQNICNKKSDCTGVSFNNRNCYLKNKPCTNPRRLGNWIFHEKKLIKN